MSETIDQAIQELSSLKEQYGGDYPIGTFVRNDLRGKVCFHPMIRHEKAGGCGDIWEGIVISGAKR
jgi:hypothetical protein